MIMNALDRFYDYFIERGWTLDATGWHAPDDLEEGLPTPEEFHEVRSQIDGIY